MLLRSPLQPLLRPLLRDSTEWSGSGLAAQVAAFFAAGEQGLWLDPGDFSTMFQDSAGTTPVTAAGQPVGKILDKSGRANHATQATAGSRPLLQQDASGRYYLDFDGVDDSLATASIDFTATNKMTVWAGVRKGSDAAVGMLLELGTTVALAGAFNVRVPRGAGIPALDVTSTATGSAFASNVGTLPAAPTTFVVSIGLDFAAALGSEIVTRINASAQAANTGDAGSGNFGNLPFYIGRRAGSSQPFGGRLYPLIARGAASSAAQVTTGEAYTNSKTGAY